MMERPNVIMMFIDDLGYGDLSCLNENSGISTPNIDALAQRGIVFRDAHSTSALCTPSRYGLLTGRYNWRSRLKQIVLNGGADLLIEQDRMTIADLFKENGYFTACVGKWHLGLGWQRKEFDGSEYGIADEVSQGIGNKAMAAFRFDGMNVDYSKPLTYGPNDYGFDYFYGLAASLDQPPYTYIENNRALYIPDHVSGVFPLDRSGATQQQLWQRGPHAKEYIHENVVTDMNDKVLDLIDEHAGEPFFIYYPTPAVHGPLLPPKEFAGKSGLNIYADMVLYLDDMVRQITEKLKEKGIWENTVFMFMSDNGCSGVADYPLLLSKGHNPSYIFRGKKSDIYEGGHRIPAIFSWPAKYAGRKNCDQMVCLSDMFATFAEMFEYKLPENAAVDSFSLKPILDGIDKPVRDVIVHSSGDGSFSIRDKDWKLILCRGSGGGMSDANIPDPSTSDAVPYQLYDLNEDISERINRAAEHPEVVIKLKRKLIEIIEAGRSTPGPRQQNTPVQSWPQYEKLKE